MNIEATFPARSYINLSRREDRRRRMETVFDEVGWTVERQQAVNAKYVRSSRGYSTPGRYALALSRRLILRRARLARVPAVLMFEDDVVLAPDISERLDEVELPADWGLFYLGCRHWERPVPAAPGLVRVTKALDAHAVAVRADHYDEVLRRLRRPEVRDASANRVGDWGHDFIFAALQQEIPSYACWPNLAWQMGNDSDLVTSRVQAYDARGNQTDNLQAVVGLDDEMAALFPPPPRSDEIKLHLGCGGNLLKGWVNLDLPQADIREPLRWRSGSVSAIFLEHVIEHVAPAEAWRFFEECRRVLRPGGVLRVSFPCIEQAWRQMTPAFAEAIRRKGWGDGTPRTALRSLIVEHGHRAAWTAAGMRAVLEAQGFTVTQHPVGESNDPAMRDLEHHWTQVGREANAVETACLEARR